MPKQLNVNLAFTADTEAAKKQILELQKALQAVAMMPSKSSALFDDKQLKNASKAAMELQKHLQAAVNVNTGQLDLSRLSTSLAASNKDLKTYVNTLMQAGSVGQNAFMQLAKTVSTAEAPITRVNARLAEMGTTLKNTVRWQLSSSILHGFIGSVQAAYGYAQDLNQSLNNIRIVTGASVGEMAAFAEKANYAAKALSTTTTSYTDAALIYYQQGIRDQEEIAGRTKTTIKLANVSRQSAEEVSQQMTAIWNNFYDGSKSLEYYADAITALGASTASSSAEIAAGLEKFAAIADTVGLSYEYATAAMATITAQTRQSADTVGTGLRTLFSRLEGLKLGETLEDGVDLNKYSKALETVGVQVLDLNGEIRDMDSILDDLGNRWDELTQAQKIALAQTVGGVRQYTNLIALMDNWDKMQANVLTAQGSEGTLQEQADIYAESWEAAQKRVKAAAQSIYADLFDDKFFITLTDGLAKLIDTISGITKGFGGLQGVLLAVGSIFLQKYAYEMPAALENFKQNLMVFTGQAKTEMIKMQDQMTDNLNRIKNDPSTSSVGKIQAEGYAEVIKMRQQLLQQSNTMSQAQQDEYKRQIELVQSGYDEVQAIQEKINAKQKEIAVTEQAIQAKAKEQAANLVSEQSDLYQARLGWENKRSQITDDNSLGTEDKAARLRDIDSEIDKIDVKLGVIEPKLQNLGNSMGKGAKDFKDAMLDVTNASTAEEKLRMLKNVADMAGEAIGKIAEKYTDQTKRAVAIENMVSSIRSQADAWKTDTIAMENNSAAVDSMKQKMDAYLESLRQQGQEQNINKTFIRDLDELKNKLQEVNSPEGLQKIADMFKNLGGDAELSLTGLSQHLEQLEKQLLELGIDPSALNNYRKEVEHLAQDITNMGNTLENTRGQANSFEKGLTANSVVLTKFASTTMAVYNVINTINNAFKTFGDENATALQKVGAAMSILMSVTMAYNQISSLATALQTSKIGLYIMEQGAIEGTTVAQWGLNVAMEANPIGLVIAAVTALIAVLAILIGSITAITNYMQRYDNAIKDASKTLEELTKKEEEARQNADNLRSSIDKYDSCVEKLKNCTKGTKEWRDALKETGTSALEVIDQVDEFLSNEDYNKLLQEYKEKGTLNADILQSATNQADIQAGQALLAKSLGEYKVTEAKLNKEIAELRHDIDSSTDSNYDNEQLESVLKNNLSDLSEALDAQDLRKKLQKLGMDVSSVSDATIDEWLVNIRTMSNTALGAAQKLGLIAQITVDEYTAGTGASEESKDFATHVLTNEAIASQDYWLKIAEGAASNHPQSRALEKQLIEAYSEATGVNFSVRNGIQWNDGKLHWQDEQGNKYNLAPETIAAINAAADAENGINRAIEKANELMANMVGENENLAKSIDLNEQGNINVDKYVGQLSKSVIENAKDKTGDELLEALLLDPEQVDKIAEAYGTDRDTIINALVASVKDSANTYDQLGEDLAEPIKDTFQKMMAAAGDISLEDAQKMEAQLKKIYVDSGGKMDVVNTYANFMEKLGKDAPEFQEALDGIDWKHADIQDLTDIFDQLGIETEFSTEELSKFLQVMRFVRPENSQSPEEQYKAVSSVTKGLSTGDIISSSDYDLLEQYGLGDFFKQTADEEYMLMASSEDLQAALKNTGAEFGGFIERLNDLNLQLMLMNQWQEKGLHYEDFEGEQQVGSSGFDTQLQAVNTFSTESGIDAETLAAINAGDYSPDNLNALVTAYGNLKDVLGDDVIEDSIRNITEEEKQREEQMKTSAAAEDVNIENVQKYSKFLKEEADDLDWINDELADNEEAILGVAVAWEDAIEGIEKIQKEWKNWNKQGLQTPEVLGEMTDVLSDMFNMDVSNDFVTDHLEEIQRLAEGDMSAIDDLGMALAQNTMLQDIPIGFNQEEWNNQVESIFNDIDSFGLENIEVGAKIEDAPFYDGLETMFLNAQTAEEDINNVLGGIGYDPKVTMETVTIDSVQQSDSDGSYQITYTGLDGSVQTATVDENFANSHKQGDTITIPHIEGSTFTGRAKGAGHSGRTGGGGGGGCFIAGTLISTLHGFYPIEKIHKGDIVLSYNEQTQQNEYSPVVDTMIHALWTDIHSIYVGTDILKATGIHPFYVKRAEVVEWLPASELQVGDLLFLASGIWLPIQKIEVQMKLQIVYNFEVSGNHNYYVGKQQILAHNKGGRRGGGRRAERNRQAKKPTDQKERYHVLNNQLQDINAQLKKIDTAYDRAFGTAKIKLLDQQIAKQKQLVAKQKEYLAEVRKNYNLDKQNLASSGTKQFWSETDQKLKTVNASADYLGMGLQFDNNGTLLNYDELVAANVAAYNAAVDKFNKAKTDDKKAKRAFEIASAQYEGFNELLKQYEETQDLLAQKEQEVIDAQNAVYDKLLEKTQLVVQLKIDVEEDSLNLLNFLLERLQDNAYAAAQKISYLGDKLTSTTKKIDAYKQGLVDIFNNHDLDGNSIINQMMAGTIKPDEVLRQVENTGNTFTENEAKAIRDYTTGILDQMAEAANLRKEAIGQIGTVMDANIKKLDKIADKINALKNMTASYKNLVDLTGREYLKITSAMYDEIEKTNVQLATQETNFARQRKDQAKAQYDHLKEQYESIKDTLSEERRVDWEQQLDEAKKYADEMTDNYYSTWENAIEAVTTRFESAMKNMAEDFSKIMAGAAGNLEGLQERFDLKEKIKETFVPEYEKMYQLTKLTRDAQKKIDESSNLKVKQELQRVQQKILDARNSEVQLSQYELDYLQRELDLKAAQLALEEASRVKSQVRMTRDSEGNYSYVYTADEQAVEEAEQEYSDKLYEMQRLNEEYIEELQSQLLGLEQDYIDAMQEAADIYGVGTTEYYEAIQNIQADYQEYFAALNEELNLALENQTEVSTLHAELYVQLTGDVYQANVDLITSWDETMLAALTGYESMAEYEQVWAEATREVYEAATNASVTWEEDLENVYDAAGIQIDNFTDKVITDLRDVESENSGLTTEIKTTMGEVSTSITGVIDSVIAWENQYTATVENMLTWNTKLVESFNSLLAAWSGVKAAAEKPADQSGSSSRGSGRRSGGSSRGRGRGRSRGSGSRGRGRGSGSRGGSSSGSNARALARQVVNRTVRDLTKVKNIITKKGGGCFDAGTKITMADGSVKNIENVMIGDFVLSYNINIQQFIAEKVTGTLIHYNTINMLDISLEDGSHLGITNTHPIYTTEGWVSEDILGSWREHNVHTHPIKIGQYIFGQHGLTKIKQINHRPDIANYTTYNLTVENTHAYIANGQLVHNMKSRFDTGGYTGDWSGKEGKIAILHSKELVLNQSDTENLLKTVGIIRSISQTIDLNALSSSGAFNNLIAPSTIGNASSLEQDVHITAEFPNVTDRNEILAAFDNVINLASQYANR